MLSKQSPIEAGSGTPDVQPPAKAAPPEPEPYDPEKLTDEIDEWESKSLSLMDGLEKQELAELTEKQEELVRRLREKVLGRERVVVNPKHRPGEEKERERLQRIFHEELGKLRDKFEKEQRKIEHEYEVEKERIEQTAEKLRESVKSGKQEGSDKPRGKRRRPPRRERGDNQPPEKRGPSKRGKD
jgi:hypothetical protein